MPSRNIYFSDGDERELLNMAKQLNVDANELVIKLTMKGIKDMKTKVKEAKSKKIEIPSVKELLSG